MVACSTALWQATELRMSLRPIPLTRALVRALLALGAVSWLLAASERPGGGSACAAPMAARRYHGTSWTPTFECSMVDGLRLDRQGDATPLPEGLEVNSGSLEAGDFAAFKLYARLGGPRYFSEVTGGFSTRWLRTRFRTAPGSTEVPGRFYYSYQGGNPQVFFGPRNVTPEDRLVILDFTFVCSHEEWTRTYLLIVRGTDAKPRAPQALPPSSPSAPALTPAAPEAGDPPGGVDLAVSAEAGQTEVSQGSTAEYTLRVTNLSAEPVQPKIGLRPPSGFWAPHWTPSQGSVGYEHAFRQLVYSPGTLAAGSTAEVRVTGTALFEGEMKLSAHLLMVKTADAVIQADCNLKNNLAEAQINVTLPPRPKLVWSGMRADVTWSGEGFPLRRLAQGVLTVANNGQADAGPTRTMLLLAGDHRHPIERVLGWVDVPALPAGASATVPFSFTFAASQTRGSLVAIIDCDDTEYER